MNTHFNFGLAPLFFDHLKLYEMIQAELENAPINEKLNNKNVQLAGFITPLENTNGLVTEFLLVPYYGACIHVPPPPIN